MVKCENSKEITGIPEEEIARLLSRPLCSIPAKARELGIIHKNFRPLVIEDIIPNKSERAHGFG